MSDKTVAQITTWGASRCGARAVARGRARLLFNRQLIEASPIEIAGKGAVVAKMGMYRCCDGTSKKIYAENWRL